VTQLLSNSQDTLLHLGAQVGQVVPQVAGAAHACDLVRQLPGRLQQLRDALLLQKKRSIV
jgi:hypothetical protein